MTDISTTAAEVIVRISLTLTSAQVVKMSGMSPTIFSPTQDYTHPDIRLKNARFPDPKDWYLYALTQALLSVFMLNMLISQFSVMRARTA